VVGDEVDQGAVEPVDTAEPAVAEPHGTLRDRVEHRLGIGRGARDHPQNLGGRCLPLQRLGEVGVLGLQLGEEPGVLDGDGRLVGEGLHEGDLALGEGPDLESIDRDHP
jgi:hypothetical protein